MMRLSLTRKPDVPLEAPEGSGVILHLRFRDARTVTVAVGTRDRMQAWRVASCLRLGRAVPHSLESAGEASPADMQRWGIGPGEAVAIARPPGAIGKPEADGPVIRWATGGERTAKPPAR